MMHIWEPQGSSQLHVAGFTGSRAELWHKVKAGARLARSGCSCGSPAAAALRRAPHRCYTARWTPARTATHSPAPRSWPSPAYEGVRRTQHAIWGSKMRRVSQPAFPHGRPEHTQVPPWPWTFPKAVARLISAEVQTKTTGKKDQGQKHVGMHLEVLQRALVGNGHRIEFGHAVGETGAAGPVPASGQRVQRCQHLQDPRHTCQDHSCLHRWLHQQRG